MKTLSKLILGAAIGLTLPMTAEAQNMFQDMALEDVSVSRAGAIEGRMRSRQVMVNESVARQVFSNTNTSKSFKMSLFAGMTVNLARTNLDRSFGGGTKVWSGRIDGFEDGFATLVSDKGRLIGHIQYGGQVFRISPSDSGIHTISEISADSFPQEEADDYIEVPASKAPNEGYSIFAWPSRIRVLAMYTPTARTEALAAGTTIRDEAVLAVAMANTAMVNTGMRAYRFKWAGIRGFGRCAYPNPGSTSTVLQDVTNPGTCVGGHTATKRDEQSADMVAVIKGAGGCGTAWYNSNGVGANNAFSVTARGCIAQHTFTHELGHNLGLNHDRVAAGHIGTNQTAYNYGMTYPGRATPVRTIMAYNTNCSNMGVFCTRVPVFSNTIKSGKWDGLVMGRGLYLPDPAVSRKKLIQTWRNIAAFR